MDTMEKVRRAMKSFKGRMKALENDPNVDLQGYCDRCSSLEHDFFKVIEKIIENEEKDKETPENISSVTLARRWGLIDNKD